MRITTVPSSMVATEAMSTAAVDQGSEPDFIRVCTIGDLPEVGAVQADFDGRLVAIARDSSGAVHAFDDTCTHQNVSLAEGDVEGSAIECWLHGSRFDMVTGRPLGPPAVTPVIVHEVRIDGDEVYVALNTGD